MDQMLSVLTGIDDDSYMTSSLQLTPPKCAGCYGDITDASIIRVGTCDWHENCVACYVCANSLTDSCFERDNKLYCKMHYYRLFSPYRCVGCNEGVSPTDLVYRVAHDVLYHTHCHCCTHCGRMLTPGSKILVDHEMSSISCYEHYESKSDGKSNKTTASNETGLNDSPIISIMEGHCTPPVTFSPTAPAMYSTLSDDYFYGSGYNSDDPNSKYLKRRGPRTTIKQSQLDVLNRIFTATPKPSKHARAKLALETGLSMRVIQVWFQNRRSKERRLKHLCNWIRANESRGLIPPISSPNRAIIHSNNKAGTSSQSAPSVNPSSSSVSAHPHDHETLLLNIKSELANVINQSQADVTDNDTDSETFV